MSGDELGISAALVLALVAFVMAISAHARIDHLPRRGEADPANQSPPSMLGEERRDEPVASPVTSEEVRRMAEHP